MIGDEELNPCSVCGHPAHIRGWISKEPFGDAFQISCDNRAKCINETEWFNTKEKAIEAWDAANDLTMSKCPFCGSEYLVPGYDKYAKFVRCNVCGATGPRVKCIDNFQDEKEIEMWNTRIKE